MTDAETPPAATDLDWAQVAREANEFKLLLGLCLMPDSSPWPSMWPSFRDTNLRLVELAPRLESYGRRVVPPLRRRINVGTPAERHAARDPVLRIEKYAKQRLIEQELYGGPYPLSSLHPLVWKSEVQTQWRAGKLRLALQEAAHSIELALQTKSESDFDGNDLNNHCFGNRHLLQIPGYKAGERFWKEDQKSARALGEAVFTAVRNPSVHGHEDPPWAQAFELLALASAYARLVELAISNPESPLRHDLG